MKKSLILFLGLITFFACQNTPKEGPTSTTSEIVNLPDIIIQADSVFEKYGVTGTFILFDVNKEQYTIHNKKRSETPFTPASTFKILNSLIGLELGIMKDKEHAFKWDGVKRNISAWNKNQTLESAFKVSCVWCYQELARQIGKEKMQHWVDTVGYGNQDLAGDVDMFWLTGNLKISPKEQIDFLNRLHQNKLPFSQRTMDIVKEIMILEDKQTYTFRGKTGWAIFDNDTKNIGWFVGYIQKNVETYIFATNVETDNARDDFGKARLQITKEIIKNLEIL